MKQTKARRKLLPEPTILKIKWRVDNGASLNKAIQLEDLEDVCNVTVGKLVRWHTEMEESIERDDSLLYECIRDSLFPLWVLNGEEQPEEINYNGRFPYGYWS